MQRKSDKASQLRDEHPTPYRLDTAGRHTTGAARRLPAIAWWGGLFSLCLVVAILQACSTPAAQNEQSTDSGGQEQGVTREQVRDGSSNEQAPTEPQGNDQSTTEPSVTPDTNGPDTAMPEGAPETPADSAPVTCQAAATTGDGQVQTDRGTVEGVKDDKTWSYLGIPYAAPPVGALRWKAPQPHACWQDIRPAKSFGKECLQVDPFTKKPRGDEDCLTLNVWTPASASKPLPVVVFIHGGGNIQGSSRDQILGGKPLYNGRFIADLGQVVVVTLNYRLGPFGFLAHPKLSAESPHNASGHYGNLDQIAALQWVQRNIAAFGGDPKKVMIFGESAGALNTCVMMTSPLAKGLFHAAAMLSGLCTFTPKQNAEQNGTTLVSKSSCKDASDTLACLRGKTGTEILTEMPGQLGLERLEFGNNPNRFFPVIDGHVLTQDAFVAFKNKQFNQVPFVIGSNADEYHSLLLLTIPTNAAYELTVRNVFRALPAAKIQSILDAYPAKNYKNPRAALVDLATDLVFTCPTQTVATYIARAQPNTTWRYFFSRRPVTAQGEQPAQHGLELAYVFRTFLDIPNYQVDPKDLNLSTQMISLWTQLAKSGNPNDAKLSPTWDPYDPTKDNALQLDAPLATMQGVRTDKCKLWFGIFPAMAP